MGGPSVLGMSSFLNRLYWFGVGGALYTWAQLVGEGLCSVVGICTLGPSAFCEHCTLWLMQWALYTLVRGVHLILGNLHSGV